jgi:hypothetical protein
MPPAVKKKTAPPELPQKKPLARIGDAGAKTLPAGSGFQGGGRHFTDHRQSRLEVARQKKALLFNKARP